MKSEKPVYDEKYHLGVNVIRGKNSSGKTTISRAISYVLGMDVKRWTPELLLCDHVIAELMINGEFVTVRRPISDQQRCHMEIYWGKYSESVEASLSSWERYPYQSSANKVSFSQALFNAMAMPEVKGYQESNITMHQIMRLMYGDQSSSADAIMITESFDSTTIREAVGDLLCGVYDDELYNSIMELSITEKKFDKVYSQLKSLWTFLGQTQSDVKSLDIDKEIKDKQLNLRELYQSIEQEKVSPTIDLPSPSDELTGLKTTLKKEKDRLYELSEEFSQLEFDIADSEIFIVELENRISSLDVSIATAEIVDQVSYKNCPSCLSDLSQLDRPSTACRLCGSEIEGSEPSLNLHRIKNELSLQVGESIHLQTSRQARCGEVRSEMTRLRETVAVLENRYKDMAVDVSSEKQKTLQSYYRNAGYLEKEIEELAKSKDILAKIEQLTSERDGLNSEITRLKDIIKEISGAQSVTKREMSSQISDAVVEILHADLDRQREFTDASYVEFDFGKNSISVNGTRVFSESSTVFLKNAFLLGLLVVSASDKRMRFPRFLLLDGIENGGMEQPRSHNLQNLIVRISDQLPVNHQIILTTAQISPEIEGTAATVGQYYSSDNKSLSFASSDF